MSHSIVVRVMVLGASLALLSGCGLRGAGPTPVLCVHLEVRDAQQRAVPGARVSFEVGEHGPRETFTTPRSGNVNGTEDGHGRACQVRQGPKLVRVEADGFAAYETPWYACSIQACPGDDWANGRALRVVLERLGPDPSPEPPVTARRGRVRACGHAWCDDDGAFVSLGVTAFPVLWLEEHDPQRLDANLSWWAARAGGRGDVRFFVEVGGPSSSDTGRWWADRPVNPHRAGHEARLEAAIQRIRRHGLRAGITIFGGIEWSRTRAQRQAVVDLVLRVAARHREAIASIEVVNEGWQPIIWGDVREIQEWSRYLAARTTIPVAPTSPNPNGDFAPGARDLYHTANANWVSWHYPRWTVNPAEGTWRAVRQPWESEHWVPAPGLRRNNEPIGAGPGMTVGRIDLPGHNAAHLFTTLVSRVGSYVWHQTPGILMGGRNSHGMRDLWDQPRAEGIVQALLRVVDRLPADIANWSRTAPWWTGDRFAGTTDGQNWVDGAPRGVAQLYGAHRGGRAYYGLLGLRDRIDLRCARRMDLVIYDPVTDRTDRASCQAGGTVRVSGTSNPFDGQRDFLLIEVQDR